MTTSNKLAVPGGTEFAAWFCPHITRKGWTNRQAADQFKVSRLAVSKYRNGRMVPSAITLRRIETVFGSTYQAVPLPPKVRAPKPFGPLDTTHPRFLLGGKEFALWLRAQIELQGWTKTQAAAHLQVSATSIRNYCFGWMLPSPETLQRIETVFGSTDPVVIAQPNIRFTATITVETLPTELVFSFRLPRASVLAR